MPRGRGLDLSNPFVVWVAVWVTTLGLTSLQLTRQLLPLNHATTLLVSANIATFALVFLPLAAYFPRPRGATLAQLTAGEIRILHRTVRRLLVAWGLGSAFEVVLSGGLPLVWVLSGDYSRSYQSFGVSSFHGFLQALFMFCLSGAFLEWLVEGGRRRLALVIALLLWPLALVNRGMFVWSVLEVAGIYLLLRRVRGRELLWLGAVTIGIVVVIGWIGDYRAAIGGLSIRQALTAQAKPVFDVLPSGFAWVYVYVTSPVNNVVAAIEHVRPTYSFFYSSVPVIPTVLRETLFPFRGDERYALGLVTSAFNTGTIYVNYLADWGVLGAVITVGGLQLLATYFYLVARRGAVWAILGYAVFFQGLVLSAFTDSFAYLPGIFQVLLALYFRSVTRARPPGDGAVPGVAATTAADVLEERT